MAVLLKQVEEVEKTSSLTFKSKSPWSKSEIDHSLLEAQ